MDLEPAAAELSQRLFTKSVVRNMVKNSIERGEWRMPTDDGLTALRGRMISMQILHATSPFLEEHKSRINKAKHHLECFMEVLREIPADDSIPEISTVSARRNASREKMIGTASAWLKDPIFRTMAVEAPDYGRWHTYAYLLAELFRACISTANTKRLGFSEGGPVAHFLEQAIPLLSGERPTKGSIASKLKSVAKEMKADSADAQEAMRCVARLTGKNHE